MDRNYKDFDTADALARVDQDKEFLFELIEGFLSTQAEAIQKIRELAKNNEREQFSKAVHAVKGALGNLGAVKAFHCARETELLCKTDPTLNLEACVQPLEESIGKFKVAYEQFKNGSMAT